MPSDSFESHRGLLTALAYRMLGSSAEAEDAVQDTFLRWQAAPRDDVRDPRAWLSTTVSRICLDRLGSAHARREVYPGTWLPEPVRTVAPVDAESISFGFLVLLERLSPVERAVFVLHRAFDFTHPEIAAALGITDEASRQALHRATERLAAGKPRFDSNREAHERLLHGFLVALASGDVSEISSLLTEDVTLQGDGGGRVRGAILRPIHGRDRVARFFAGLVAKTDLTGVVPAIEIVNDWPALVARDATGVRLVINIEIDGDRIAMIRNVVNPEKLALRYVD